MEAILLFMPAPFIHIGRARKGHRLGFCASSVFNAWAAAKILSGIARLINVSFILFDWEKIQTGSG
jgi:hypothetical protein